MGLRCISHTLGLAAILILSGSRPLRAGADEDWQKIVAMERGPEAQQYRSRDEARKVALQILAAQERSLRAFLTAYPADKRVIDAKLRLAHLLTTRGDLEARPNVEEEGRTILDELQRDPATPPDRLADVSFAKVSLAMRQMKGDPTPVERDGLLDRIMDFKSHYPADPRVGPLLAEVATLYDSQPKRKEGILMDALHAARDEELKLRINDDLHRIALLGQPIPLSFTSVQGRAVDVKQYRGSVVVLYFFASSSQPAMMGMDGLRDILSGFEPGKVVPIGISVDDRKDALLAALKALKIDWPVFFDGKGWESPVVRSFGINALPTVWILDRHGNLRTLNAISDTEDTIRQLLREK